jgi:serine protease Do
VTNIRTQSYLGTSDAQAAGTGIIVSKDGYILTNKHVISGANHIQAVTSDGTSYDNVTIVGTDPLNDVAYLKIQGVDNLTPAELGDSSTVTVGQSVVAIGNALGQYQNTVTSGIISGMDRPVDASSDGTSTAVETLTDLLQTDAAINPGNSGGPLLNMSGQVIGLNTAIAQGAQGIGFSIPINATKGALKGVLAGKGVHRAYIGLRYVVITPDVAKQDNLPVKIGAYVHADNGAQAVVAGAPAAQAGIQDGDIITKINALVVGKNGDVSSLIGAFSPGDSIQVTFLRGGKEQTASVTLGTY